MKINSKMLTKINKENKIGFIVVFKSCGKIFNRYKCGVLQSYERFCRSRKPFKCKVDGNRVTKKVLKFI